MRLKSSIVEYLKAGAGYDCPGHDKETIFSVISTSKVLLFDSFGTFGGELPTGSKKSNKFGFFHLFLSDYLNPGDGNACAGQDMAKGVPNATLVFDFITSGNFGEVPVMGSNLKIHNIFEIDSYL